MYIAFAGIFLCRVVIDVEQTHAGVAFWEFNNSFAGAKFLLLVESRYVGVRKDKMRYEN